MSSGKLRRRDKWRNFFASSPSVSDDAVDTHRTRAQPPDPPESLSAKVTDHTALPSRPTEPPTAHPISSNPKQAPVPSSSYDILQRALQQLSGRHCETIKPFISSTSGDAAAEAVEQSLAAAKQRQQECDDKRWKLTFAGRTVVLKEVAGRVVQWLNRFKSAGDLAASIDPVHVALPWAVISFVLQAASAEAEQTAALLVGCETALYIVNRLKVYMEFLIHVPPSQSRTNFENGLVELYTHVLSFLALAIEAYQLSTARRTLAYLWRGSDVQEFEQKCEKIGNRVEIEAQNCDRTLSGQDRTTLQQMQETLKELQQIRSLQESLEQLDIKIDLGNLKYVEAAAFDARDQVARECHAGTRVEVLREIQDWANSPTARSIFWLQGMAGTGKSTISYTIADWLSEQRSSGVVDLGASFFFKRGEGDRGSATLLFPTIAHQLVRRVPGLSALVAKAVKENPDICSKTLGQQFRTLIREPLESLPSKASDMVYVIVIDALDECRIDRMDKADTIDVVPQLWSELRHLTTISTRLFITSRPERHIQEKFNQINKMSPDTYQELILQNIPLSQVQHDIFTFLTDKFTTSRKRYDDDISDDDDDSLGDEWPGKEALQELTNMAAPLFIVAATIHRFVCEDNPEPRERLQLILRSHRKVGEMSPMAAVYLPVLQQLHSPESNRQDQDELYAKFRTIIGSIVTLAEPLSKAALVDLLSINKKSLMFHLRLFSSVLQIPVSSSDAPIRPLHLSFSEYVTGAEVRDQPFGIDSPAAHNMLMTQCLELLTRAGSSALCENMCGLSNPGQSRHELASDEIGKRFSSAVQYACRYWTYHAQNSEKQITDHGIVHRFLQEHFLHWLEALSLLDCTADAIIYVDNLRSIISRHNSTNIAAFLEDARRFLLSYHYVINLAPLQLYSSTIVFAPQDSIVRNVCGRLPDWVTQCPITPRTWGSELQELEGHDVGVDKALFSPDGTYLASTSRHAVVILWDVRTGQEIQKLKVGGYDALIAFSPDGSYLASASDNGTAWLWNVRTGQELQQLVGDFGRPENIAFSPNGTQLAVTYHELVWLWNIGTGQEVPILEGHSDEVRCIVFSPDGSRLASGSRDATVRLWSTETGREIRKLEGFPEDLMPRAFSPDCSLVALTSSSTTVHLWNINSGQEGPKLNGHPENPGKVVFSPDGSQLAALYYSSIQIWDTKTGQTLWELEGHTTLVFGIAYSPSGDQLASASQDATVRLWDTTTGQEIQKLEGVAAMYGALVFSPDGNQLASASDNDTLRLWDLRTGKDAHESVGDRGRVGTVVFSPDGRHLASVSAESTLELWDSKTGQVMHTLEGHSGAVLKVVFSPDSRLLASASNDQTVRLWDLTGRQVLKLEDHDDLVSARSSWHYGEQQASASQDEVSQPLDTETRDRIQLWEGVWAAYFRMPADWEYDMPATDTFRLDLESLSDTDEEAELLVVDHDWIRCRGERLLWLPPAYRTRVSTVCGDMVALGGQTGTVTFLQLQYP